MTNCNIWYIDLFLRRKLTVHITYRTGIWKSIKNIIEPNTLFHLNILPELLMDAIF